MKANGTIERWKARLAPKGYDQILGFEFDETFSPIAKQVPIWLFLALAIAFNRSLYHVDVNNAILNGV